MKKYFPAVRYFLLFLAILGFGSSNLLGLNTGEVPNVQERVIDGKGVIEKKIEMVGDSLPLGCWKVKIQYKFKMDKIGQYKFSDSGELDGTLTFDEKTGQFTLSTVDNSMIPIDLGNYDIGNGKLILDPDMGQIYLWIANEIQTLASAKNITVDPSSLDYGQSKVTKSNPKISFKAVDGQSVPTTIGSFNYTLTESGVSICIGSDCFDNARITLTQKITFEPVAAVKCAKSGSLELNVDISSPTGFYKEKFMVPFNCDYVDKTNPLVQRCTFRGEGTGSYKIRMCGDCCDDFQGNENVKLYAINDRCGSKTPLLRVTIVRDIAGNLTNSCTNLVIPANVRQEDTLDMIYKDGYKLTTNSSFGPITFTLHLTF